MVVVAVVVGNKRQRRGDCFGLNGRIPKKEFFLMIIIIFYINKCKCYIYICYISSIDSKKWWNDELAGTSASDSESRVGPSRGCHVLVHCGNVPSSKVPMIYDHYETIGDMKE